MNKSIKIILGIAVGLVLLVAIAGFVRFNFTNGGDVVIKEETPAVTILTAKYIHSETPWPPKVTYSKEAFICNDPEWKSSDEVAKMTNIGWTIMISGKKYCVNEEAEGGAGSTYITYEYSTLVNTQLAKVTFTLRHISCMNYDEPERSECVAEQNLYNADSIANDLILADNKN